MSFLSVIAFISGALGVWLTIRQTIWCWPVALVSVVTSMAEFYNEHLYGDMSLQVFYFFAGVYGWIYWHQHGKMEFRVERMKISLLPLLLMVTLAQAVLYYFLLVKFGGDKPVLDAFLTGASLTATYMMTRKWLENWMAWVFIDGAYVFLYGIKSMWLFAVLYLLFTIIALYGWIKWRKAALKR
jgi:nicotinamide mononucleotide transporter